MSEDKMYGSRYFIPNPVSAEQLVELKKQLERFGAGSSTLLQEGLLANSRNMHALTEALKTGGELVLADAGNVPVWKFYGKTEYRQHPNGLGWVAATAHVDQTAYVHPFSIVHDKARVLRCARILEGCSIKDYALVRHGATLKGVSISDNSIVEGNANILSHDRSPIFIYGISHISGEVEVSLFERSTIEIRNSKISDRVKIKPRTGSLTRITNSKLEGCVGVYGIKNTIQEAHLSGNVSVFDEVAIVGISGAHRVVIEDNVWLSDKVHVRGEVRMMDNVKASGSATFVGNGRFSGSRHYKRGTHR